MYRSIFATLAAAALLVTGSAGAYSEGVEPPNDEPDEPCWISPPVRDPYPAYWEARNDVSNALTEAR